MPDIVPYEPPPKNDRVYARVIPLEQLPPNFIITVKCCETCIHREGKNSLYWFCKKTLRMCESAIHYDHLCSDKLKHWHPVNGIIAPEPPPAPPPPKRGWLTWFKETFG